MEHIYTPAWEQQGYEIQVAFSKIMKFESEESGDTLELIERPSGGVSVVLADASASGKQAKAVSASVVRKVLFSIAEGVRDGASARSASDKLFTDHNGKVSCYLDILSVDLESSTIVLSRNNPTPIFISRGERTECIASQNNPIGLTRSIKPDIMELSLETGLTVIISTDGIYNAGQQYGIDNDMCTLLESLLEEQNPTAQSLADNVIENAITLDQGQPADDMSVVVLRVIQKENRNIRRMALNLPLSM